jgi:hypothetical protein
VALKVKEPPMTTASTTASTTDTSATDTASERPMEDVPSTAFIGRIYRISSPCSEKIYVGSTRKTLSSRLIAHQQGMRKWERGVSDYVTSYALIVPGVTIDLIEEDEYHDTQQMREREAYWISRLPHTVNHNVPGRSQADSHRVSGGKQVPCNTCGKIVRRREHWKHQQSRACMMFAFNRAGNLSSS